MKLILAALVGGLIVWLAMSYHKPAPAPAVPTVQATPAPERATLHDQMECATATENYAKEQEVDDPGADMVSDTIHSHYDPIKRECTGVRVHIYHHIHNRIWGKSVSIFDPIESVDIGGAYWSNPFEEGNVAFQHGALNAWGLPGIDARATDSDFGDALQKRYGVNDNQ